MGVALGSCTFSLPRPFFLSCVCVCVCGSKLLQWPPSVTVVKGGTLSVCPCSLHCGVYSTVLVLEPTLMTNTHTSNDLLQFHIPKMLHIVAYEYYLKCTVYTYTVCMRWVVVFCILVHVVPISLYPVPSLSPPSLSPPLSLPPLSLPPSLS